MKFLLIFFALIIMLGITQKAKTEVVDSTFNQTFCKDWELTEYKEDGKVQELPDYLIEFKADGTYVSVEEGENDKGTWTLNDDSSCIIFDKGTPDEDIWTIINFDNTNLTVKFTDSGKKYQYILVPAK